MLRLDEVSLKYSLRPCEAYMVVGVLLEDNAVSDPLFLCAGLLKLARGGGDVKISDSL